MIDNQLNVMRREAERVAGRRANARAGTVSAYDPARYTAKVVIEPDGVETGWLPVLTPWAGDGWGMFAPPSPGDTVDVHFQEAAGEAGFVSLRFFGDKTRPLPVPSGEFWLVHQSGSKLKLLNDGTVEIVSAVQINSTAPLWRHTGDLIVTGDISDRDGAHADVGSLRDSYNAHHHTQVQPGGGTSGLTDLPVP